MDRFVSAWEGAREYFGGFGYGDALFYSASFSLCGALTYLALNTWLYAVYHYNLFPQYRIRQVDHDMLAMSRYRDLLDVSR